MQVSPGRTDRITALQGGLGWATLVIVLVSATALGANRPLAWITLAVLIILVFSLQLICLIMRPLPRAMVAAVPILAAYLAVVLWSWLQFQPGVLPGLAHPAWDVAPPGTTARMSADPGMTAHGSLRLATYGMVAWIMAASAMSARRAWAFVAGIALSGAIYAAYGLATAMLGVNPVLGWADGGYPVRATFASRNAYATWAAFGLFANMVVFLRLVETGQGPRATLDRFFASAWPAAFGALLCASALALTASRAGTAAAVVGFGLLVALAGPGRRPGLWAVLAVLVGFVALTLTGDTVTRILEARVDHHRFVVYREVWTQILERPLLGNGLGAFHDSFRAHLPLEVAHAEWRTAHNSYLENAYELGVPAALLLYGALAGVGRRLLKGLRDRRADQAILVFVLACMVTAALHAMVDFTLQMPATASLLAACMGLGWAQSFGHEDRSSPHR